MQRGFNLLRPVYLALVLAASAMPAHSTEIAPAGRRSGYEMMGSATRAMQDDDAANPGMLWVLDGEALWNQKTGAAGLACADCHGDAGASMKGVAARYPAFVASLWMARVRPLNRNTCAGTSVYQYARPRTPAGCQ